MRRVPRRVVARRSVALVLVRRMPHRVAVRRCGVLAIVHSARPLLRLRGLSPVVVTEDSVGPAARGVRRHRKGVRIPYAQRALNAARAHRQQSVTNFAGPRFVVRVEEAPAVDAMIPARHTRGDRAVRVHDDMLVLVREERVVLFQGDDQVVAVSRHGEVEAVRRRRIAACGGCAGE